MRLTDFIKSKKGSAILENALILPLSIFMIFAVFSLAIHFYETVCLQTGQHSAAREEKRIEGKSENGETSFIRYADFISEGLERDNEDETEN